MTSDQTLSSSVSTPQASRVIVYHQTHHVPNNGPPVSILPLITRKTGITHVIVAALHLNDRPGHVTLNDHEPDHASFATLWAEVAWLRASGVKVLGMLGGAAPGTFNRLDVSDPALFDSYYNPLRDVIREHHLDGIDLDIEEPMTLDGAVRLIDRLRADFGPDFLITLAPVATALLVGQPHLSGPDFNYHVLEAMRGHEIAWYNTQFYNGWGDASTGMWYEAILLAGWRPNKVVFGVLTNPGNGGSGYLPAAQVATQIAALRRRHPTFGGVMGWEYFNALPGGMERPWEWVETVAGALRLEETQGITTSTIDPTPSLTSNLPVPQHPYLAASIKTLQDLGFSSQQAIAALNTTNGNVEYAAGLLFSD